MIELRWLEREITVGGDSFNGGEVQPIKTKIRILQYRYDYSEWNDVPTVKQGDV